MASLLTVIRPWTDSIRSVLGATRRLPLQNPPPNDEVFPVHYFDDTEINRHMVMCCTMRFDDVLDADYLHRTLARLLEIGDWRKLGGRVRLSV